MKAGNLLPIDLNEKSIVASDGSKHDLSEVARLHTEYGIRRSNFYAKHPGDRRLKQKFSSQSREKNRVKQFLDRVSKAIVQRAKENRQAIVLERLKGIRYAHTRGNGEGRAKRRRIAVAVQDATLNDSVQSRVGRNPSRVRLSLEYFQALLQLRLPEQIARADR